VSPRSPNICDAIRVHRHNRGGRFPPITRARSGPPTSSSHRPSHSGCSSFSSSSPTTADRSSTWRSTAHPTAARTAQQRRTACPCVELSCVAVRCADVAFPKASCAARSEELRAGSGAGVKRSALSSYRFFDNHSTDPLRAESRGHATIVHNEEPARTRSRGDRLVSVDRARACRSARHGYSMLVVMTRRLDQQRDASLPGLCDTLVDAGVGQRERPR
jgi:hypothetical protein